MSSTRASFAYLVAKESERERGGDLLN